MTFVDIKKNIIGDSLQPFTFTTKPPFAL